MNEAGIILIAVFGIIFGILIQRWIIMQGIMDFFNSRHGKKIVSEIIKDLAAELKENKDNQPS